MDRLRPWLSFQGRLSRLGYWRRYLKLTIAGSIVWIVGLMASIVVGGWAAVLFLPLAPLAVANCAIVVTRLHDRNRSGWWGVPFFVLPFFLVGMAQTQQTAPHGPLVILFAVLVATALQIWGGFEVFLMGGARDENRFGRLPAATR